MVQIVENLEDFQKNIQSGYVVVDFHAVWCQPCRTIAPKYAELASNYPSISFLKVDIDEISDTIETYGVEKLPTFILFHEKNVIVKSEGKLEPIADKLAEISGKVANSTAKTSNDQHATQEKEQSSQCLSPSKEAKIKLKENQTLTLSNLDALIKEKTINVLFFPFVADISTLKPSRDPNEPSAVRTLNTQDVMDAVSKTKHATSIQVIEINHIQSPEISEKYGIIPEETPTMKILHKGIHYSTINFGSLKNMNAKLEELSTIYN